MIALPVVVMPAPQVVYLAHEGPAHLQAVYWLTIAGIALLVLGIGLFALTFVLGRWSHKDDQ